MEQLHNEKNQTHQCSVCGEYFTSLTKVQKHIAEVHPEQPKPFK